MALYRVQGNGKAPAGLQVGDEVVTGGGTYRILGVNADGSYRSSLSNKYQTIYNYRGSYGTAPAGQTDTAQVRTPSYTPSGAASEAKAALDRVLSEKPGSYTSRWDKELDALYDQIANRKAFSYDLGADPMYRQYREQYQSAGRLAMENTMGAAASLTGGYGSSYSQQAGQQAYNAYLQKLNEVVPELYAQARSQYDREGSALSERYALISSREKSDYDRYRDQVSDYYAALSDARGAYQSEAQRSENLALQYAKLANDNYWNELNYRSDWETRRTRSTGSSSPTRTSRLRRQKRPRRPGRRRRRRARRRTSRQSARLPLPEAEAKSAAERRPARRAAMRSTEKAGRRRTDDKASGRKAKPAHCGRCAALVRGRYVFCDAGAGAARSGRRSGHGRRVRQSDGQLF